jgi:hypothetical protein
MKAKKKAEKQTPKPAPPQSTPVPQASREPIPPGLLFQLAEEEPTRRLLEDYGEVIRLLRENKKFTFREIAEWLNDHNVEADHNAVYREYTKGMSDAEANLEDMADEETERREAGSR